MLWMMKVMISCQPFQALVNLIKTTYQAVGSVLDSLLHLLRVKENTWIAGRSRLWPRCTLATSGKLTRWPVATPRFTVFEHEKSPGVLGIFGDLHKGVLGLARCFSWSCWKSQAFPNHLAIQGALFDPTWSVQTGGRRRRMLRPWQPREFASSFTHAFLENPAFFWGEGCSIEKQWVENAFRLSSQAVIFSLICQYLWNNRFLAINLRKKIHNHCPTPTVFMVLPMLILSLLAW